MKLKNNFILRKVADEYIVIPVGSEAENLSGVITLNHTGAFLWNALQKEVSYANLISMMIDEYSISKEIAEDDLNDFINCLKDINCLE